MVVLAGALWLAGNGFALSALAAVAGSSGAENLTQGWLPVPLKFEIQHPYDLKAGDRYAYDARTDTHDFWVYYTDKPHAPPPNQTAARTEMRLETYRRDAYMFDADYYVCPGTFACIAQVFDAAHGPVAMVIAHPDGTVMIGRTVIATNVVNRWWNLKIINDLSPGGKIKVYADNVLAGTFKNRGPRDYYFKCGVYSRKDSHRSEVRVRDIKLWMKPTPLPPANVKHS